MCEISVLISNTWPRLTLAGGDTTFATFGLRAQLDDLPPRNPDDDSAWHARADALSSLVVAAGIGGALIGFNFADAVAAIVVGAMIVRAGLKFGWEAIRELIDTGLAAEEVAAAVAHDGVHRVERALHEGHVGGHRLPHPERVVARSSGGAVVAVDRGRSLRGVRHRVERSDAEVSVGNAVAWVSS